MPRGPMIITEGLGKRFGDLQAVANLSLRVNAGEVFGFLGPNGAGKTTNGAHAQRAGRPNVGLGLGGRL